MTESPASTGGFTPGVRAMLVAAAGFAGMSALVKLAGARIPSAEIVVVRAVFTLVFSLVMIRRAGLSPWGHDKLWLAMRGIVGATALQFFFYAVTVLPLAESTVLHFTNPLLVSLGAALFFRERLRAPEVGAVLLGIAGVLLVARPAFLFGAPEDAASSIDPTGLAAGLAGALLGAGAYLIVRRLRATEHPYVVVLWFPAFALPLALPFAVPVWVWPTPREWLILLGVGALTQLGQVKMTQAFHLEAAARVSSVSYAQVLFAMILGVLAFGEIPEPVALGGAACIGLGTLLVARAKQAA